MRVNGGGSGFSNPMSAVGDLIIGGASGAATRLAAGSNNDVLTLVGGSPAWQAATSAAHDIFSSTHQDTTGAASAVLGDMIYANSTPKWAKLSGNTTSTKKFLTQTGNGTISAAPGWNTIASGDLPSHNHAATDINSGTLAIARGGTGSSLVDPNADRILFWDDSAGAVDWLTIGSGLSITGTTLSATGGSGGMTWSEVTGTTQTIAVNTGYIANNASLVVFTLPSTAAVGDLITVVGKGAGGWKIAQGASQIIQFTSGGVAGANQTTTGTNGYVASADAYDAIELVCIVANTTFAVLSYKGNIIID